MDRVDIKSAEFIAAVGKVEDFPPEELPEIALIGRSNAGKSTLLNRLACRKKLALVSALPGRTCTLNFFRLNLRMEAGREREIRLIDLPGYGYARAGQRQGMELGNVLRVYLTQRRSLRAICLLIDARRLPESDEKEIQKLCFEYDRRVVPVITKIDKLNRSQREQQVRAIAHAFGLEPDDLVISGKGMNIIPLWKRILAVLD